MVHPPRGGPGRTDPASVSQMGSVGFEPTLPATGTRILSPLRLPIPPQAQSLRHCTVRLLANPQHPCLEWGTASACSSYGLLPLGPLRSSESASAPRDGRAASPRPRRPRDAARRERPAGLESPVLLHPGMWHTPLATPTAFGYCTTAAAAPENTGRHRRKTTLTSCRARITNVMQRSVLPLRAVRNRPTHLPARTLPGRAPASSIRLGLQ